VLATTGALSNTFGLNIGHLEALVWGMKQASDVFGLQVVYLFIYFLACNHADKRAFTDFFSMKIECRLWPKGYTTYLVIWIL
jgi:hypothetical protein